jgi:5-formyltetrahydrofolate cyclo-ligase
MACAPQRSEEGESLSDVNHQKTALRAEIRAALKKIPPVERAAASRQACALLEAQPLWRNARSILFYAPLPDELDVWPLLLDAISAGKTTLLPRFDGEQGHYSVCQINDAARDIEAGKFGIREPNARCARISLNRLDLILVPGIAFDLQGHRLGRGRGFYDRLLAVLSGPACGVAFDQQIVSHIPTGPHDVRLSCILTPTRWQCESSPCAVLK